MSLLLSKYANHQLTFVTLVLGPISAYCNLWRFYLATRGSSFIQFQESEANVSKETSINILVVRYFGPIAIFLVTRGSSLIQFGRSEASVSFVLLHSCTRSLQKADFGLLKINWKTRQFSFRHLSMTHS